MKEILIVSDSHFNNKIVNAIIENHPTIDTMIHCGDFQEDPKDIKIKTLYAVKGNNDYHPLDHELIFELQNKRFFITHGHLQDVESELDALITTGKNYHADIICFGHTHHPIKQTVDNLLIINPGSVRFPRGGRVFVPTYAILTIDKEDIDVHFYHAKEHHNVDDEVALKKTKKEKKSFFPFNKKK